MHRVIVPTCENIQLIRAVTVLSCLVRWHLQIKTIKDALTVISVLQLNIVMQIVLDAQIHHKVLRLAQLPHLDIQVVSCGQTWLTSVLNKAGTRD